MAASRALLWTGLLLGALLRSAAAQPPTSDAARPARARVPAAPTSTATAVADIPAEAETMDLSPELARVGFGITAGGVISAMVGGILLWIGLESPIDDPWTLREDPMAVRIAVPLLVAGGLCTAGGIILWSIGEWDVERRREPDPAARAVPQVVVGAGAATLSWTF